MASAVVTNADAEGKPQPEQPLELTPLHALRDEMIDNPEHPLAKAFNWEKLPEKVALDEVVRPHDTYSDEYPTLLTRLRRSKTEAKRVSDEVAAAVGRPIDSEELFDSANRINDQAYRKLLAKQHRLSRAAGWDTAEEKQHQKALKDNTSTTERY